LNGRRSASLITQIWARLSPGPSRIPAPRRLRPRPRRARRLFQL